MLPYPFFRTSYYRRPYPYYSYKIPSHNENNNFDYNEKKPCFPSVTPKQEQGNFGCSSDISNFSKNKDYKSNNINSSNNMKDFQSDNDEYFEIFGLKLHFDDLLIIALLFFLYQEDVKDTYLYIALILLLLS